MITAELIARINALSHKQRDEGLNDAEREEQRLLRREYLDSIKAQLKGMLDNIEVVDEPAPKITRVNEVSFSLRRQFH